MPTVALSDFHALDDAALVRAARAGETACLGALFERHRTRLFATALAMTGYRADAEDAVHETFLIALTRIDDLKRPEAVVGWMRAILQNCCRTALRQNRRRATSTERDRCFETLADDDLVESRIEASDLRDWIWAALQQLSPPLRLTAMLRYFGSWPSYDDIAETLGVPVGTVRSRLAEARLRLSDLLIASAGLRPTPEDPENTLRLAEFNSLLTEAHHGPRDRFLTDFADDLVLSWTSGNFVTGRYHLANEIISDIAAGVTLRANRMFTADRIAVVEARFINPPEDPWHCPPGVAMVLVGDQHKITHMRLHFSARPPRMTE